MRAVDPVNGYDHPCEARMEEGVRTVKLDEAASDAGKEDTSSEYEL